MTAQPQQISVNKIESFKRFYEGSTKLRHKHYLVYYKMGGQTGDISFAAVASKKGVSKSAVKRNRAKRRIKNAFFEYLKEKQLPVKGIDLVFMANRSTLFCEWSELKRHMAQTCDPLFHRT